MTDTQEPEPAGSPAAPGPRFVVPRLVAALLLLGISSLAVLPAPIYALWMPAVGVIEWGYCLAPIPLLLLLGGLGGGRGRALLGITLFSVGLLLSPLVRASIYAGALPGRVRAAFGAGAPRSAPGAPALAAPLAFRGLFGLSAPEVEISTHCYRELAGLSLNLDLYLRPGSEHRPLVIVIHGGSWRAGGRGQLPAVNHYLAARGYAVAAISYRLAPKHRFPAALEDVQAAISYLQSESKTLGIDPQRIVLMGRSAGGHLALLAAYRSKQRAIRGVVAYYPPTDLEWSWRNPGSPWVIDTKSILRDFLGGSPEEVPAAYRASSPLGFVSKASPPTLLIQGGRDELVSPKQSKRLVAALREAGVPQLELALPWASHGCEANLGGPSGQLSSFAIERFLAQVTR